MAFPRADAEETPIVKSFDDADLRERTVDSRSSPAMKVALFRSLFRGREDVYALRFESQKSGRSGYQPDCANEWVRGVCEKPKIKCTDCPHQRFHPVNDMTVTWHLQGHDDAGAPFVMGLYPMLLDETCFFLAVDFDKSNWRADANAFLDTCRLLGIPAALERSRSGNGAHVWIFFDRAIPASLARRLGAYIITETMERRPEVGLRSYDRFFPNQDTLPKGGFGNLIALPLQKRPRDCENSVFLDSNLAPYPDQWAFLSTIQRIDRPTVERVLDKAEAAGRIVGVLVPSDGGRDMCTMANTAFAPSERFVDCRGYARHAGISAGQRNLRREGIATAGATQPACSAGVIPESGILPGSSHAPASL